MKYYITVFLIATLLALVGFGAANDTLITFGTRGPDKYMDGTTVKDGECYALVWTKTGATFAGLTADGKAVGEDSVVIVFAPLAKGGCCPKTLFQIDTALASQYSDGTFALYLVDTRLANGKLGVDSKGLPIAVNGYGEVKNEGEGEGYAIAVTKKSEVPAGTPQPTITAIKVIGDNVYLTVKNTVPYLQYTAKEVGVDGGAVGADALGGPSQGSASIDAEITVIAPKKGSSGFYSIARN